MKTQYELFATLPVVRNPATYWQRYTAYMRSARWREIAEKTKRIANFTCQYLGPTCSWPDTSGLAAHHRTYINIFRERPGIDTICVCRNCHIYLHAHPKMSADNDNRPWGLEDTG